MLSHPVIRNWNRYIDFGKLLQNRNIYLETCKVQRTDLKQDIVKKRRGELHAFYLAYSGDRTNVPSLLVASIIPRDHRAVQKVSWISCYIQCTLTPTGLCALFKDGRLHAQLLLDGSLGDIGLNTRATVRSHLDIKT